MPIQAPVPPLAVAPMEGLTGFVFRTVHARRFGGADSYWMPFVTPTTLPQFTDRQLRDLIPEHNAGIRAVPQLLTRRPADFIWAAKALSDFGYDEVNLNLGCPAGTVVAKGKGSGFLREPDALADFLDAVFFGRSSHCRFSQNAHRLVGRSGIRPARLGLQPLSDEKPHGASASQDRSLQGHGAS